MARNDGGAGMKRSAEAQRYRKLYKTKRWQALREWRLRSEPYCRACDAAGVKTLAVIADHTEPHRGDVGKFHDPDNLQSLCKMHHDRMKQSVERRGFDSRPGPTGWPTDPNHPANRKA